MNKYYFDVKMFGDIELEVIADNLLHANALIDNFLREQSLSDLINKHDGDEITISGSIIDIHPNIKNKKLIRKI